MENVRVTAPQKLFQNSVIMAIEKYGLHSFSVTRRKTNWHKREHCKISKLRIRGDKFITLGTDGKLRLFLCQNGQKLWTSQCERTNLFANMFFTKAGIFIWQKSGPTCFSVKNGTMKWQLPAKNLTQHWIVTDDIAYIIDEKQYLRAYEAQSGRRRNELDRELEANVASAIVANKNYIVFGLADSTAMIIRSGDEPLRVSTNGSQFCNVLSLAKEMVICAFVKPPKLSAYSLRDGSLLWDKAIASRVKMSMTRRGRNLYYGDDRDFLVARDAKTGEKLWERYGNIVARFRLHATPRGVLYCSSSLALNEVIDGLEP